MTTYDIVFVTMQESCDALFSVLSAILWLGNLRYRGDNDNDCLNDAAVLLDSDTTVLRTIASLLNIDYDSLVQVSFGHIKAKK